jgi:hypothetical protein
VPLIVENIFNEGCADAALLQEVRSLNEVDIVAASPTLRMFRNLERDGTAIVVNSAWSKQCAWTRSGQQNTAVMIHRDGQKLLFICVYLPDSVKSVGVFEDAVNELDGVLEEIWTSDPWNSICIAGDLNCEMVPVVGVLGHNCSGISWSNREGLLLDLSQKTSSWMK